MEKQRDPTNPQNIIIIRSTPNPPLKHSHYLLLMSAEDSPAAAPPPPPASGEEAAARAVQKKYEGLMTVRAKAIKGKGAWYWSHLEPVLVQNADTGLPKAVKLRCSLCETMFSASNPSRTASEHLKRGTCPNFSVLVPPSLSSSPPSPLPISSLPPPYSPPSSSRKRSSHMSHLSIMDPHTAVYTPPPALPAPPQPAVVFSGGKEDLGALAMLQDSVKKLKSPKASPGPILSKSQVESAISLLSDWFYDSCGVVSLSSVDHPKFRDFLRQVGLPAISRRWLAGNRLDARFAEARADADARIKDALFFQLSSAGWGSPSSAGEAVVTLSVNLPNGTSVFHRAVPAIAGAPSDYAEEVLFDSICSVAGVGGGGGGVSRCAGVVSDRFKSKALHSLESRHPWMVNISCQIKSFNNLLKDLASDLPLFRSVASNCSRLAQFLNCHSPVRTLFHKYQVQELGHVSLIQVPPGIDYWSPVFTMLEDILSLSRPIQLTILDESYKPVCTADSNANEIGEMVKDMSFWTELESVHSLVTLVKEMIREMETDRPLVSQCLTLWEEVRTKVKNWCARFNYEESPIWKLLERRFKKSYHPAWSAAFILDPLYLEKDASGKYLPPFKYLTPEQEKDVDRLITRMVSHEEAHIALMELMKWRAEGLDPLYAQAVQVREPDPNTGKLRVVNPQSSRLVWETCLSEFRALGRVAVRLIFLHATACGFRVSPSIARLLSVRGSVADRVHKLVFVSAHSRLERREFGQLSTNDEERDLNEVFSNLGEELLHEQTSYGN